jgi:putative spermidine/putrescine transport system permease protein
VANLLEAPAPPKEKVRAPRSWGAVAGLVPFALYLLVFLGGPLYFVISGALSDPSGQPTLENLVASVTQPQYLAAFWSSLKISLVTALIGAVFGAFLAQAVLTSRPTSPLRRVVSTASGVLAYFGGVPLAFAFIAALGQTGLATIALRGAGIDLYAAGFRIDSLTGLGLTYVYFQIPLMVILITPALAGATLVLFGNAFAAYATALALTSGTIPLVPTAIASALSGNVLANQQNVGLALGFDMVIVIGVVMVLYLWLQRRASKWMPR